MTAFVPSAQKALDTTGGSIHGYRLCFWQQGNQVYWLLAGGDKNSQKRDIERAKILRREVEEMNYGES